MTNKNTNAESENWKFAKRFIKTGLYVLALFTLCALCIISCTSTLESHNNPSSYSSSDSYDEDYDYDDYDDDWVDTDDGKTYLKLDSEDGGTDYVDSDGEYFIHKNSDGTGAIIDTNGNAAVDSDGDGEIDAYSTDNGKTWYEYY